MLKNLLIGLLAIVAIVGSIAARQGASFDVVRSVDVRAAPARVAPLLAGLHPPLALARVRQEAATTESSLTLAPNGGATRVTWRLHGPLTVRTRLITSFIGMDLLLGSDMDKSLAGLKAAAEK